MISNGCTEIVDGNHVERIFKPENNSLDDVICE